MTKQIPLTQGLFATIDDEDFEYFNQWKWCAQKIKNTWYATRYEGKQYIYMHRAIMNTPKGMQVDHIDMNGLNNTRSNLRNCTNAQNNQNKKKHSDNSSGYKGVHQHQGKWRADIYVNGKNIYLGSSNTAEGAAKIYDDAAKNFYGEFANTNF